MMQSQPTAHPHTMAHHFADIARQAWHKARNEAWSKWMYARHGTPDVALDFGVGFGDDLLCTTIGRELRERGQSGVWMLSGHPGIFAGNSDFRAVLPRDDDSYFLVGKAHARLIHPFYCARDFNTDHDTPPTRHILAEMCAAAGLTGEVSLRPYLNLSQSERAFGKFSPKQIAIQSSGGSAIHSMRNKEWFPEQFAEVVDLLKGEFDFVQIGSKNDPELPGTRDLRGQTSLRETAAVIVNSKMFVGLVGFLMHLARAVDRRAVIVYGGREAPWQSGYICNENLSTLDLPCAPCWRWNSCDFDRVCMSRIMPADVATAIRKQADRHGKLEVEQATLAKAATA